MTNRDIYNAALRLLGESTLNSDALDYEERAPYLLATVCSELFELDQKLRVLSALPATSLGNSVLLELDAAFPLCSRLHPAVTYYLAAMLILDTDEERSDTLYDRYCDAISTASASISESDLTPIPGTNPDSSSSELESIVDCYFPYD